MSTNGGQDCLGFTGHPTVETPHLDRLAHEGINFTRAYTATPTCVPARAAIFTGLAPRHHGFVGDNDHVPWHYDVTMAGLLADGGYHTQCVGKMHVQPARNLMGKASSRSATATTVAGGRTYTVNTQAVPRAAPTSG